MPSWYPGLILSPIFNSMSRLNFKILSAILVASLFAISGCDPQAGAVDAQGKGMAPPTPYKELTKEQKIARIKLTPMSDAAKKAAVDAIEKGTDK